jgi:hypothetical protein
MIEVINANEYSHGISKHRVSYRDVYMDFWVWHLNIILIILTYCYTKHPTTLVYNSLHSKNEQYIDQYVVRQ